jgi:hypothetical protein
MVITQLEQDEIRLTITFHRVLCRCDGRKATIRISRPNCGLTLSGSSAFWSPERHFRRTLRNSGSIAVPIGESTTPQELFASLGDGVRF